MNYIKEEQKVLFQTYRRQPVVLVRGKGSFVWDAAGKKYLDLPFEQQCWWVIPVKQKKILMN